MVELRVPVDGAELVASFTPSGRRAIVALHGAAAGTREFHLYRHLHAVLPRIGIGVATFDRRGEGASTGERSVGRFEVQARDALAVGEALGVDGLGLWGFSQGGWVAPLAASTSARVSYQVLIASTGVTPAAQMRYAMEEQLRRSGYPEGVVGRAVSLRSAYEEWIHAPEDVRGVALRAELAAASDEPWWPLTFLDAELPDAADRAAWIEEMDFDPVPVFGASRVPTLLFYGREDEWSPVEPSIAAWRRARADGVDAIVIPGAGHDLTLADGRLAPAYEEHLLGWLASQQGHID
jgi:pimeloyl-ACP methyl ester carboxylesterase